MPLESPTEDALPLKLLSLDGGGVRGISTLIILKYLMKRINPLNPPKPCDYFDLIGGTSTGGIIAIMLGRLRMDVQTCIDKYIELASAAFEPKRSKANVFSRAKDKWEVNGAYRSDVLEREIREAVKDQLENKDPETKLLDPDPACKVFVCAFTKAGNTPVLLRSYTTLDSVDSLAGSECAIWQAARATSAAATFFDHIKIGRQTFVDGATGLNNPVEQIFEEAKSIWPDALRKGQIQCLVSIGTGVPDLRDFGDNLKQVLETLKEISVETETTEKRFYKSTEFLGIGDRYFRFNVDKGLSGIGLDEHKKVDKIEASTEAFLRDPRVKKLVDKFLVAKAPTVSLLERKEKDRYLEWLYCIDTLSQYKNTRKYRTTESTCQWFLTRDIERWKAKSKSFMWLTGKAGSGKSVLSSAVINKLEKDATGLVVYYYFSFRDDATQSLTNLKHSLLMQIVRLLVHEDEMKKNYFYVPKIFQNLFNKYSHSQFPLEEHLHATLEGLLNEAPNTYIVIDGLDECANQTDRAEITKFLGGLCQTSHGGVHILITSRRETDIEAAMKEVGVPRTTVLMNIEEVKKDIKTYLIDSMKRPPYEDWTKDIKKNVAKELTSKADGVFRWVTLQLMALKGKVRGKDVEMALKCLPKSLEETYGIMLSKIENLGKSEAQVALSILRWLTYCRRPLLLSEVAEIAIFEVEKCSFTDTLDYAVSYQPKDRFPSIWNTRTILSGLVTVSGIDDRDEAPQDQDGTVSFSHFTVQEYLQGDNTSPRMFHLEEIMTHGYIMRSCLAYINYYDGIYSQVQDYSLHPEIQQEEKGDPDSDSEFDFSGSGSEPAETGPVNFKPFPLLLYAAKYWWRHGIAFYHYEDATSVYEVAREVISPTDKLQGSALELSIEVARASAVANLVPKLRNQGTNYKGYSYALLDEEARFDFESPLALHLAADEGDERKVRFLLDAGLDVNKPTLSRGIRRARGTETALHIAVRKNHKKVAELLVDNNADLNIRDYHRRTPLSWAAGNGFRDIAEYLIEKGARLDVKDTDIDHVLRRPPWTFGDPRSFITLSGLYHDVARHPGKGWTALHWAIVEKQDGTAILLVEKEANIVEKDMWGGCPLSLAITKRREAVLRAMVSHNREVCATGRFGQDWTALHLAALYRHETFWDILLQGGADITIEDGEGLSVLDLVVIGAQSMGESLHGVAKFWKATMGSAPAFIKLLHTHGVSLGAHGELASTPLHFASVYGQVEAAEGLLECGASVDARDKYRWTPLLGAACEGHDAMASMLLSRGADVHATTDNDISALILASANGHLEVVQVLLKAGADTSFKTFKDGVGKTALEIAVEAGKNNVARLLQGLDPDSDNGSVASSD